MRRSALVALHEFRSILSRRSFWAMTLAFPLLIGALSLGNTLLADGDSSLEQALSPEAEGTVRGYVDESGLLRSPPPGLDPALAPIFSSEDEAGAALEEGDISGYYLIPADFVDSGEVVLVERELHVLGAGLAPEPLLRYLLIHGLTGDPAVAAALVDPVARLDIQALETDEAGEFAPGTAESEGAAGEIAGIVPYVTLFVIFFALTMSSSYLLQSVTREKENRTAEVLLVTLRPRQLMLGKLAGLAGIALLQIGLWIGAGVGALFLYFDLSAFGSLGVGAGLIAWAVLFLLLAHLAYGSLVATLGALVPSQREGSQFIFLVLLPLMIPLWFNYNLTSDPHGSLATALSLIPLTAPVAMLTRLAAGGVPWWQPALAAGGLAVTAYLFALLAARVFRADRLLSMERLRWRTLARALRARRG